MNTSTGSEPLFLTGDDLTSEDLERASSGKCLIELSADGLSRMAATRGIVHRAIAEKIPVYGVTTGLGSRSTQALDENALSAFSLQTIRGRAHAIGEPLPVSVVRASMIVRANTLLKGAAAAQPLIAEHIVACLNANLTPVVGATGSIGAGDLVWNATMALGLIGEGAIVDLSGAVGEGAEMLAAAGIRPLELGPRDGLALCNHASYSAGSSSLALTSSSRAYEALQSASALTMESFRANLSPLDARILALRPQPGQAEAAAGLQARLRESSLHETGAARRLQDPLSIRNVVQVHGAVHAALMFLQDAVQAEINGASDNPVALVDDDVILSAGAYHTPHLTNAVETVSRAFVHACMMQLARLSKMMDTRFTDLPTFLAARGNHSNGFAPVLKTAEAITSELAHAAQPVAIWPSINADGVEDSMTATPTAAQALMRVADRAVHLTAIEGLIAAQGIDLRGCVETLGPPMRELYERIRSVSKPIAGDRPLSGDIVAVAAMFRKHGRT